MKIRDRYERFVVCCLRGGQESLLGGSFWILTYIIDRKLKRWGRMLWMDQEQDILNRYMIFTERERTDKCVVL